MSPTRALLGVIMILGPLGATVERGSLGQRGAQVVGLASEEGKDTEEELLVWQSAS